MPYSVHYVYVEVGEGIKMVNLVLSLFRSLIIGLQLLIGCIWINWLNILDEASEIYEVRFVHFIVITSGFAADNIIKVLQDEMKGTLFHKDAHLLTLALKSKDRRKILMDVTDVLEDNENIILAENSAVIKAPEKIKLIANSVRKLAEMEEPIGCILKRSELASDLGLESVSCSFGVLLIVFKSRPDALVQKYYNLSVLGHSNGICHVYVDKPADIVMAKADSIICKSRLSSRMQCNDCPKSW
uniref:Uncharacterized protein n=1 Tax=Cucumis melo TaxID=3656 RepID=A0A9I9E7L3_CUCME